MEKHFKDFNVTQRDRRSELWELGDLLLADGGLTRSAQIQLQHLPPVERVHIQGNYLLWKLRKPSLVAGRTALFNGPIPPIPAKPAQSTGKHHLRDMLASFAQLHAATDQEVLGFARVWGRLRLCVHNMPYQHGSLTGATAYRLQMPPPLDQQIQHMLAQQRIRIPRSGELSPPCSPINLEPLATWRFFSRQCRAMLDIASHIQMKRPGSRKDWRCLYAEALPTRLAAGSLESNQTFLVEAIRAWMSLGIFRPWIHDLQGRLSLTGADLFAKLAAELALAVSRSKGLGICSICGRQYEPRRKPTSGRKNYCGKPSCRREGARLRKLKSRQGAD